MLYHLYKNSIHNFIYKYRKVPSLLSVVLSILITLSGCNIANDSGIYDNTSSVKGEKTEDENVDSSSLKSSDGSYLLDDFATATYDDSNSSNTTVLNNGKPLEGQAIIDGSFDGTCYVKESNLRDSYLVCGYNNSYPSLSVPTDITYIDGDYYIVDCYHSQIIYNDNLSDPLTSWKVLTDNNSCGYSLGHTIVSDGIVLLADDTENNRILVFEKNEDEYALTQTFDDIGNKPHYIVYDKDTDAFYCWSSYSGEMYIFRHKENDSRMYLTNVITIERLSDTYVRSFTIDDDNLYFVSGLPADGSSDYPPQILEYDLKTFTLLKSTTVPSEIAGMVMLTHIDNMYYITVSTDLSGSQDAATMICASSIDDIANGNYEIVYDKFFVGGGTPYYIGFVEGSWYLTEHRLTDHAIWSFKTDQNGAITSSAAIY